jgi:hypothetical protein
MLGRAHGALGAWGHVLARMRRVICASADSRINQNGFKSLANEYRKYLISNQPIAPKFKSVTPPLRVFDAPLQELQVMLREQHEIGERIFS